MVVKKLNQLQGLMSNACTSISVGVAFLVLEINLTPKLAFGTEKF